MTPGTAQDGAGRDVRDLRRGVAVNFLGYALKIAHPVLLIVLVRRYGAEDFGLFTFAQAVVMFVLRFCLLGLDKTLLWWVPRRAAPDLRRGIRPALAGAVGLSVIAALAIGLGLAPLVARLGRNAEASSALHMIAFSLPPMAAMELLLHATMGRRRMEAQVVISSTVVPMLLVAIGLALSPLELGAAGLSLAFVAANVVGCGASLWAFERIYRGVPWPPREPLRLPPEMRRFALPMWLAEMSNSLLLRLDTYAVVAAFDLRLLGIYGVVTQIGNAIRGVRRSFDPIVLAIVSEIGAKGEESRLASSYSYATFLVCATQLPIFAFLIAFAPYVLSLFGRGFEEGTAAVLVLCAVWVVNSAVSLAGIVVSAYGHTRVTLANVWIAIVAQAVSLRALLPEHGLEGAAIAVGIGYSAQSIAQLLQMRQITGRWNYTRIILWPIIAGLVAGASMAVVFWACQPLGDLTSRVLAFVVFGVCYGLMTLRALRARLMSRAG